MAEATADTKAENSDITYIKLPGAKNTSLWEYFGSKSTDGKSIWKEGKEKPNAYCLCRRLFQGGNDVLRKHDEHSLSSVNAPKLSIRY